MEIYGKKALIIGGALNIGNVITIKLVESGAQVAVHYFKSETDAFELCDMINNDGGTAFPIGKDLSLHNAEVEILNELSELDFIPDILINCTSSSYFIPLCKELGSRVSESVIINIINTGKADNILLQEFSSITRDLSEELAPSIRVNSIISGKIEKISDVCEFLIKDDFVTGQLVFDNGGQDLKDRFY